MTVPPDSDTDRVTDPTAFLRHRPPILCIDRILSANLERVVAEGDARGVSPDGVHWEGLLIEGLAQTAAALNGAHGEGAGRGLLVGLKDLRLHRRVRAGERLRFEVELIRRLSPLVLVHGQASVAGEVVAEGELKFFMEPL